jgi:hypothetical protein
MKQFKTVSEGVWVVTEDMQLEELNIAEGASVTAPEGKKVTMTVNGVATKLQPASFQGDIRLTVTDDIPVRFFAYKEPMQYRAAAYIKDGKVQDHQSVAAAIKSGDVTGAWAKNVKIVARDDAFNGIFVDGEGEYVIDGADIDLEGLGGNDFNGYGAAIMSHGTAKVTVNHANIHVRGASRNSFFVGEHSEMTINDSVLYNETGILPAGYVDNVDMGGMMRVPWMLGLRGNSRATNLADFGTAHYNRCHLMADGWGVLSTDAVDRCRLFVTDCLIEVVGPSGYGAFSIGDCNDVFDHCVFNVPDYALIMANETAGGEFINGTVVNSKRFGVMSFLNMGGKLIVRDSTFNTEKAVFLIKGCTPEIDVKNAKLNSKSKTILQLFDIDDPTGANRWFFDPKEEDVYIEGRDLTVAVPGNDVIARFADMEVNGDFFNATTNIPLDTSEMPAFEMPPMPEPEDGAEPFTPPEPGPLPKNLELTFTNATVTGRITAAKARHRVARVDKTNCEELGELDFTARESINNGVIVNLEAGAVWNVTDISYLTKLVIADGAVVNAKSMTVDGVATPIVPGTYTGKIVVE